jgi:hypothetical protein
VSGLLRVHRTASIGEALASKLEVASPRAVSRSAVNERCDRAVDRRGRATRSSRARLRDHDTVGTVRRDLNRRRIPTVGKLARRAADNLVRVGTAWGHGLPAIVEFNGPIEVIPMIGHCNIVRVYVTASGIEAIGNALLVVLVDGWIVRGICPWCSARRLRAAGDG